jgi:hypothetical protein
MKTYLVINNSSNKLLNYKDKYRCFSDKKVALAYAKSCGYESPMEFVNDIGVCNSFICGNTDVSIVPIEII